MRRIAKFSLLLSLVLGLYFPTVFAQSNMTNEMFDLAKLKSGVKNKRISSTDPTGGNRDHLEPFKPGMKAAHVLGKLRHLQIIHVEVESIYVAVALVLNFNACALLERHSEIARQTGTVFRTGRKRQGCVVVSLIPALSEERADGRLYRRIIWRWRSFPRTWAAFMPGITTT